MDPAKRSKRGRITLSPTAKSSITRNALPWTGLSVPVCDGTIIRLVALATLLFLHCATLAAAPRNPIPARYAKWLNEDVVYIITDEERKAFLGLTADAQRDKFMDDFWEIRNPAGGSPANSYKEEHYRRIDYANAHFGRDSNTPGWMTDMGRTWILFGKPTSQHPFTGYSQIYPLNLWFYDNPAHSPSLPSFFYVLFYMPGDIGEYKFYRPFLDGPMQLVRGSQFNTNADVYKFLQPLGGDLAHATLSLVAGDPINTQSYQPDMSSDMLISKIQNFANDHFNVEQLRNRRAMHTLVISRFLLADKDLSLSTLVLTDPLFEKWLDYYVPIDDEKMGSRTDDGQFAVDFRYSLKTAAGTLILEDEALRKYPAYANGSAFSPFEIAGRIPLIAGAYQLEVQVVNAKSGRSYSNKTALTVPANGKEPWLSGPLLADSVLSVPHPSAVIPYQYFGAQFHPLFRMDAPSNGKLRVLFQVYQPEPSDGDVEYVLANVALREARIVVTEHIQASEFKNNLLLKSKSLDTASLPAGEYMLAVRLKSASGPVLASINQRLHIVNVPAAAPLYFAADPQTLTSPGLVDYLRGLCALAAGEDGAAQSYLERSLKVNPANSFARQFLVQTYYRQHRYREISELYGHSVFKDFAISPESMAEIVLSLWDSGDPAQARSVLKSARGLFPEDALLASTEKLVSKSKN
jgi:GWxTD domain-containing protein